MSSTTPSRPRIGPYEIEVPIGIGATGRVYRAQGPRGPVALKIPRRGDAGADVLAEATLLRRCAHPHLVRCLDHAPDGSWMALEFIEGTPIAQWARREGPEQVIRMGLELLGAIQYLHGMGIVHGDVQPLNILVDDWGHPKLFDLANAATPTGRSLGTPGYIAPERLAGGPATPATDVYGFGASLYAALSGHAPFESGDPAALLVMPLHGAPLPTSTWRVDVPASLDRLLLSMLQRDPAKRPSLARIEAELSKTHRSTPGQPVVGMARVRRRLREEICAAADGKARVVVMYGPGGSGRRTLLQDAARHARREGLHLIDEVSDAALQAASKQRRVPVAIARLAHASAVAAAHGLLQRGKAGLLLLYGTHPSPELATAGAVHLTPEPLDLTSVGLIAEWLGASTDVADDVWRLVEGHPRSAWLALESHATRNVNDRKPFQLPESAARILKALRERHGVIRLDALASQVQIPIQTLLDHCSMLEACGMVRTERDGRTLRIADAG